MAVPGPETWTQVTLTAAGGSGRPSSVTDPERVAGSEMLIERLGPASTTGAVLGAGPPVSNSIWSSAAALGAPSYDSAVRVPLPVISTVSELDASHPETSTAS